MENQPQKTSILQKLLGKSAPGAPEQKAPPTAPASTDGKPVAPVQNGTAAPAQNGTSANNSGNAFTQLFGVQSGISTASVNTRKPGATPSIASLLGPRPIFSRREHDEQEQKITKIAKTFFQVAIVFAVLAYGFVYSQLNPNFTLLSSQYGPNVAARFERSNDELQKTQTDLNLVRFRLVRLMLDEIDTEIDTRTQQKNIIASPSSTAKEKSLATAGLAQVEDTIKKELVQIQSLLSKPFGIDTFSSVPITEIERETLYHSLLQKQLENQLAELSGAAKTGKEELQFTNNVIKLVNNASFRVLMKSKDFGKISDIELDDVLTQIREQGTDQLASIDKIRKQRINWEKVISDINTVTRKTDLYYGQGLFKTVGGFLFSSYRFDEKSGRISISGITKTSDSKTFSFIAHLVDSIEKSPQFKDIDFRSFSKTKDETGDYSSSLNLEFSLQNEPDPRDEI